MHRHVYTSFAIFISKTSYFHWKLSRDIFYAAPNLSSLAISTDETKPLNGSMIMLCRVIIFWEKNTSQVSHCWGPQSGRTENWPILTVNSFSDLRLLATMRTMASVEFALNNGSAGRKRPTRMQSWRIGRMNKRPREKSFGYRTNDELATKI